LEASNYTPSSTQDDGSRDFSLPQIGGSYFQPNQTGAGIGLNPLTLDYIVPSGKGTNKKKRRSNKRSQSGGRKRKNARKRKPAARKKGLKRIQVGGRKKRRGKIKTNSVGKGKRRRKVARKTSCSKQKAYNGRR